MSSAVRYQVMPPLSTEEYQELYDDIKTNGIHTPIHVDEEGVVIDGHHRSKIASELGIPCPVIAHDDLSESQKRSLAFSSNLKRRHLNREQRRELREESLKRDPQLSNREHARRTGADHKTVVADRERLEALGEIPQVDKTTDSMGREWKVDRPASQSRRGVKATSIPQSELDELNTPSPFVGPGEKIPETSYTTKDFPELNNPPEPAMTTPTKTKGDKTSNYLTEAAERINLMLETLSSIDFTNTTSEAKAAALENLEQATRHLTTIKRHIK